MAEPKVKTERKQPKLWMVNAYDILEHANRLRFTLRLPRDAEPFAVASELLSHTHAKHRVRLFVRESAAPRFPRHFLARIAPFALEEEPIAYIGHYKTQLGSIVHLWEVASGVPTEEERDQRKEL